MIHKMIAVALAALGIQLSSCAQNPHVRTVGVSEFEQALTADSTQLLDVRTAEEYAQGRIAGALNIDIHRPDFMDRARAGLSKTRPVYVYCRSGRRSMTAAGKLAHEGFQVINLDGGILAWTQARKPVTTP